MKPFSKQKFSKKQNPPNWYTKKYMLNGEKVYGLTSNDQDIDYFGIRVLMKPSIFIELTGTYSEDLEDERFRFIFNRMKENKPFANAGLRIQIPNIWFINQWASNGFKKSIIPAITVTHDGRHRMLSSWKLFGDELNEVYLFFSGEKGQGIRNATIDNNFKNNLIKNGLYSQSGDFVRNAIKKVLN